MLRTCVAKRPPKVRSELSNVLPSQYRHGFNLPPFPQLQAFHRVHTSRNSELYVNTLKSSSSRWASRNQRRITTLSPTGRLADKVAIVTGASSGLGRAIVLAFAAQGMRLVVCADLKSEAPTPAQVSSPELKDRPVEEGLGVPTHELIEQRFESGKGIFVKTDVGVKGDVEGLVREAVESGGRLDVMVNNAGLGFEDVQMHEMKEETWDAVMRVNLRGVFLGCKFACAQLLKQDLHDSGDRGWIINTASGAGLKGVAGGATAYCASKGAVVNFTRAVAIDYAKHKIHVNAICPGFLRTPMTRLLQANPSSAARMVSETPWGAMGAVDDVAKVAVFLASEDACWVTGIGMPVDGGWAAR